MAYLPLTRGNRVLTSAVNRTQKELAPSAPLPICLMLLHHVGWQDCPWRVYASARKTDSKSLSLIACISVGVDRMQRNFEPMRKQVEAWQKSELTDVTAKVVIYEAFVEGVLEAPKHLARTVHDLYFEPLRIARRKGCIVTRSLPPGCRSSRSV